MKWVLGQNDPEGWPDMPGEGHDWIARADGEFKDALDRTKYATRYPGVDPAAQRQIAHAFLHDLESRLQDWIFDTPTLADFAILPFVRQFAFIDKPLFDAQPWPKLHAWLDRFLTSDRFATIMPKYPQWKAEQPGIDFPPENQMLASAS